MSLSAAQLAIRKARVSATDVAAICGANPWKSAADVQAEKLFDMAPIDGVEHVEIGNMIEPGLIQWAGTEIKSPLQYPMTTVVHPKCDVLCATPDAAVSAKPRGVEAFIGRTQHEGAFGDYTPGRFAWLLANVKKLETPTPYTGRQGLFDVELP